MSLSTAFSTAQQMFNNVATQTSTTSTNILNKENPNYARRAAITSTTLYGAQIITTQRSQDMALLRQSLTATSQYIAQKSLDDGLSQINEIFGQNDQAISPQTYMVNLQKSLANYANKPGDTILASAVVTDALTVANSLNSASAAVQQVRADADKNISLAVTKLNDLLAQFKVANDAAMTATSAGLSPNDAMDVRETVLKQISEIVGVTTLRREPNDLVLYTNDGTTLFEASPRVVSFTPTPVYDANTTGNRIKIDGVPVNPGATANSTGQGSLAGLLQVRDQVAPTLQSQLDEMARGLISVFSETDSGVPPTTKPGLFTWSGGTVPTAGTVSPGIASLIKVNPLVDPFVGGNPARIRDGSINGAAFNKNTTGSASYSTVLQNYANGLTTPMAFDTSTELETNTSLMQFATKSNGWLQNLRSTSSAATDAKEAMRIRSVEAYSNATGVNLDNELALLLDLEHSYSASSKLLTTIDDMMKTLLNAVG